jgi:alpha-D-xyloside xylohydrolase
MKRRSFLSTAGAASVLANTAGAATAEAHQIHPGVWRFRFGTPEAITPITTRHYPPAEDGLQGLPPVAAPPITVAGSGSGRGYLVSIPLAANEAVYGLGLQLQSFLQRGTKKRLRVNADPKMDTGDTHAPAPFYVTTRGYGVLIDTARYATFYCGGRRRRKRAPAAEVHDAAAVAANALPAAYRRANLGEASEVLVEIAAVKGVDVYVFAGPSMREAVQRYNLFSGGGPLPPRWGLGVWYRVKGDYGQDDVLKIAGEFRDRKIPCDVIGLEPGWQTHAYSCSYVWSGKFPAPAEMAKTLAARSYRLNLWEHAFTHPSSPLYEPLAARSGDYEVWGGLAPDLLDPEARRIFGDFHEKEHLAIGVSGYKLDECDNSDMTGNWSFPEISRFPSGADGEQMHSLFGQRYQDSLQEVFERRRQRTYGLVRSSGALAAPYPYVLYSDLYDHKEFIRALANSGFSGLLWTPELRAAKDTEDLVRRLQSVALSPMALINGWYIKNPPWKQVDRNLNNADKLMPDWEAAEAKCRAVLELRMRLIPYLHAAFVRYHRTGLPPFRALVLDYPDDPATWLIDDQYLIGDSLLAAPAFAGEAVRKVYLPEGEWFDFWTGSKHAGARHVEVRPPLEQIPLFVRGGSILPLATPTLHTADPASWKIAAHVYGEGPASTVLYEDDGSWAPSLDEVRLSWDAAARQGRVSRFSRYEIGEWKQIV